MSNVMLQTTVLSVQHYFTMILYGKFVCLSFIILNIYWVKELLS